MPTYLNCVRLRQAGVDHGLRLFLTTVGDPDVMLRAKTAFPEFFTETPGRVHKDSLSLRAKSERKNNDGDIEKTIKRTLSWFGLEALYYEGRDDGKEKDIALPSNLFLKHSNDFDGLTSEEPWIIDAPDARGVVCKILVLDVLEISEPNDPTKFFLIGTYADGIDFRPETEEFDTDHC